MPWVQGCQMFQFARFFRKYLWPKKKHNGNKEQDKMNATITEYGELAVMLSYFNIQ